MADGKRQLVDGLPPVCCQSGSPLPRERKGTSGQTYALEKVSFRESLAATASEAEIVDCLDIGLINQCVMHGNGPGNWLPSNSCFNRVEDLACKLGRAGHRRRKLADLNRVESFLHTVYANEEDILVDRQAGLLQRKGGTKRHFVVLGVDCVEPILALGLDEVLN